MYFKPAALLFFTFLAVSKFIDGQGCSDAGFCTINSFKPGENVFSKNKTYLNQIKAGISFGKADNSISVIASYLEYNRQLGTDFSIDAKLTSISQSGNGISAFGISDLFLTGNYAVSENIKFSIGGKIPFNKADKTNDGLPLPMDYQSSLGTFDLITGFGFNFKKILLVIGYQQPLTQNKNKFLPEAYPANSKLQDFTATNKFKRAGDILLRLAYPINIGEKIILTPGLLPIYHLSNDKFTNFSGSESEISGSKGLTLNTNIFLDYSISQRSIIQLSFGAPSSSRDTRPDGLTRSYVVSLEFRRKF